MTTWTEETQPSTTWTNENTPLLVQPETLYDDTNTYNVSEQGKGYYYNDRVEGGAYSEEESTTTIWTEI